MIIPRPSVPDDNHLFHQTLEMFQKLEIFQNQNLEIFQNQNLHIFQNPETHSFEPHFPKPRAGALALALGSRGSFGVRSWAGITALGIFAVERLGFVGKKWAGMGW